MRIQINQLQPQSIGIAALNPTLMHDSSSRLQMMCSHIGQSLVVMGSTVRRMQTGVEREYGKYTHNIKMPCNAIVIKTIQKFPPTYDTSGQNENPLTIVVYENTDHPLREVGILEIPTYHSLHQYFGFKYVFKPIMSRLVPGATIQKGTVIADSPSVTENGDYRYGLEAQMALMSIPAVIEDGAVVSESFRKRLTTKAFGSRVGSWGKNRFPLNLYGDERNYKPFPDIGQYIRPDGLLFALRPYDEMLAVVNMTPDALREPDLFDRKTYAAPLAKVIDVVVHKGTHNKTTLPIGMETQTNHYYRRSLMFYDTVIDTYNKLRQKRRESLYISPEFERLMEESLAMTDENTKEKITKTYNRNPIDEWQVEVFYEYELVPTIGYKITDLHGGSNNV